MKNNPKIVISKNGPYLVSGNLPLDQQLIVPDKDGVPLKYKRSLISQRLEIKQGKKYPKQATFELCRCGKSKNMPFCDGTHIDIGFNDGNGSL